MPSPCAVLIGAPALIERLDRLVDPSREVLTFPEDESHAALDAIVARRPDVVALERAFATSSRGTAFISRVSLDPGLSHTELWVVSTDTPPLRLALAHPAPQDEARLREYYATRRAQRVRMRSGVEVQVDGTATQLIDLSVLGAQVVSPTILRPNQRVRVLLPAPVGTPKTLAVVAWASYEQSRGHSDACYRAGLEFKDADPDAVHGVCAYHQVDDADHDRHN